MGGRSSKTVGNVGIFDKKFTERNGKIIMKVTTYKFGCLVFVQVSQFQDVKM